MKNFRQTNPEFPEALLKILDEMRWQYEVALRRPEPHAPDMVVHLPRGYLRVLFEVPE